MRIQKTKTVTEPFQVGEYYAASAYHDIAYLPPIMIAASVCMALFFENFFLAVYFMLMALLCYMIPRLSYDRFLKYANLSEPENMPFDFKKAGFMVGGMLLVSVVFLLNMRGEVNWDFCILGLVWLGIWFLWSLLYYTQTWLRLGEWYARRDFDVCATVHDDASPQEVAGEHRLAAAGPQELSRQLYGHDRKRRYVARLKRYKCSTVLSRTAIMVNTLVFYFIGIEPSFHFVDISFTEGLLLMVFLTIVQVTWWCFRRYDERLKDAIYIMGGASRMLIDFEWLAALCVTPGVLLAYSLLSPGGMLPWQSAMYSAMVGAQITLFFLCLYPGRAPD